MRDTADAERLTTPNDGRSLLRFADLTRRQRLLVQALLAAAGAEQEPADASDPGAVRAEHEAIEVAVPSEYHSG